VQPLPIDSLVPELLRALEERPSLVLVAEPGAGKTTRVPPALLSLPGVGGPTGEREIVVLEPRRLAARMAATRVAAELGGAVGDLVGYQVRFEEATSARTRLRFVTEGILTRRLLRDPELSGVGAVVLDEFHERHLHGDVALAVLRELQRTTRPDLRLVVMSATLDAEPVARFLDAPIFEAKGRTFPIEIRHADAVDERHLDKQIASAVRGLISGGLDGDVLVFVPGAAEIRRAADTCAAIAQDAGLDIAPLHGDLTVAEQDRAVRPGPRRKIILSTNIAESSITVEGVAAVVDSGLARRASHAAWSGMPRLAVEKISRASATQRAGRAGRVRAGTCVRLYTKADHDARPLHDAPEIARLDLAQTWLELRAAGRAGITFFEAPPESSVRAADQLLERLGALDGEGRVTPLGRELLRVPLHPRAARLFTYAEAEGAREDGAVAAALLGERSIRRAGRARFDGGRPGAGGGDHATTDSDLVALVELYREAERARFSEGALRAMDLDSAAVRAVSRAVQQLLRGSRSSTSSRAATPYARDTDQTLRRAALAGYPDRVARRRGASQDFALSAGGIAELSAESSVRDAPLVVALDVEPMRPGARPRVSVASAIEPEWLIDLFPERLREVDEVTYDATADKVLVKSRMLYDAIAIHESEPERGHEEAIARVLAEAALAGGVASFLDEHVTRYLARVRFAATVDPAIAAIDDEAMAVIVREAAWGKRRLAQLRDLPLLDLLRARVSSGASGGGGGARLDTIAPERVTLPSGREVRVTYETTKPPWIESYISDFFGLARTPRVGATSRGGAGGVPLVVHLLAPNRRAVQITQDLEGFWARHYPSIRKELARVYPKHAWPEDPSVPVPMRFGRKTM
jgi:ATP-dependent helicase HrpB